MKKLIAILLLTLCSFVIACTGDDNSKEQIYTITFNANGNGEVPGSKEVIFGDLLPDISIYPAPTNTGFYFAGYYDAPTGGTMYYTNDMQPAQTYWYKAEDTTLYAQWTLIQMVTIIFRSNFENNDIKTQTVYGNTELILNTNTFERTGYTFVGWSYTPTGIIQYTNETNYTVGLTGVSLYAVWSGNKYTISFDANGGAGGQTTHIIATFGQPMPNLNVQAPAQERYYFTGYFDAQTGGTMYYRADLTSAINWDRAEDTILYAQWILIPIMTITFHANHIGYGGNTTATQIIFEKTSAALTSNAFLRTGYTFAGWSATETGIVEYTNGASYTVGELTTNESVNLYAVWRGNEFTVTFDQNDGTDGQTESITAIYGQPMPELNVQAPTKAGYYFIGYFDAPEYGTMYYTADLTSARNWDKTNGAVLYAQWIFIPIMTITFHANYTGDGGNATTTQIIFENTSEELTANKFERTGYTFIGWSYEPTGAIEYTNEASYFVGELADNEAVSLYALWTNQYTISFNANGGTGGQTTSLTATYGQPMPQLSTSQVPVMRGFVFTGYFDDPTGGTMYYTADLISVRNWEKTSDNILYAQWEEFILMVRIPAGTFIMGSHANEQGHNANEVPQHQVTLTQGFFMGKYLVTQEQYLAVMDNNPSDFSNNPATGENQTKRPVEMVSWYYAIVFCNRLSIMEGLTPAYEMQTADNTNVWSTNPDTWGSVPIGGNVRWDAVRIVAGSTGYRLPTEAQWEYACRAGTTTAFNTGETISDDTGWHSDNSNDKTRQVGLKPPNTWGLYDMHGNVWEWCWDWFGNYTGTNKTDPTGAISGAARVIRGGSWDSATPYFHLRSAFRTSVPPQLRINDLGFRVVRP